MFCQTKLTGRIPSGNICLAISPEAGRLPNPTAPLADEPIHAYRENGLDRTRRWARNNGFTVVAGVGLLLCLGIGGAGFGLVTKGFNVKLQKREKEARKRESLAIWHQVAGTYQGKRKQNKLLKRYLQSLKTL